MKKSLVCYALACAAVYAADKETSTGWLKGPTIRSNEKDVAQLSIKIDHSRSFNDVVQTNNLKFEILEEDEIDPEDDIVFWRYIPAASVFARFSYNQRAKEIRKEQFYGVSGNPTGDTDPTNWILHTATKDLDFFFNYVNKEIFVPEGYIGSGGGWTYSGDADEKTVTIVEQFTKGYPTTGSFDVELGAFFERTNTAGYGAQETATISEGYDDLGDYVDTYYFNMVLDESSKQTKKRDIWKYINKQETAEYQENDDDDNDDAAIILGIFIPLVIIILVVAAVIFCNQNKKCCYADKPSGCALCFMSFMKSVVGAETEADKAKAAEKALDKEFEEFNGPTKKVEEADMEMMASSRPPAPIPGAMFPIEYESNDVTMRDVDRTAILDQTVDPLGGNQEKEGKLLNNDTPSDDLKAYPALSAIPMSTPVTPPNPEHATIKTEDQIPLPVTAVPQSATIVQHPVLAETPAPQMKFDDKIKRTTTRLDQQVQKEVLDSEPQMSDPDDIDL